MEKLKKTIRNSIYETLEESRISDIPGIFEFTKKLYLSHTHTLPTDIAYDEIFITIYEGEQDIILDFLYRFNYNLIINGCDSALSVIGGSYNTNSDIFSSDRGLSEELLDILTDRPDSSDRLMEILMVYRLNINYALEILQTAFTGEADV